MCPPCYVLQQVRPGALTDRSAGKCTFRPCTSENRCESFHYSLTQIESVMREILTYKFKAF